MFPQRIKKGITDNPKKLANLIDLVNLPSTVWEFVGESRILQLGCFMKVWLYIKTNNLQDPSNKNMVNCNEKLKSILLGKPRVELAELPALIKLHFPKEPKQLYTGICFLFLGLYYSLHSKFLHHEWMKFRAVNIDAKDRT